jgi:predicted transcriptional regulator YdeE
MSQSLQQNESLKPQALSGFHVVGITMRTNNANGKAVEDINALWQRFFEEAVGEAIPAKDGNAIYAIYHDYEGDHTAPFSLTIGCKVGSQDFTLPQGLDSVFVQTGEYQIFAARGEQPKALMQTWEGIWRMPLTRAFQTDVEIYGPRFFEPDLHEVLVCIGVK